MDVLRQFLGHAADAAHHEKQFLQADPQKHVRIGVSDPLLAQHPAKQCGDLAPGKFRDPDETHLTEKVLSAGQQRHDSIVRVLPPEIDGAAAAGTIEIARVIEELRRDQQKIAAVKIQHGIAQEKAAGALLQIIDLIISVAVIRRHDKITVPKKTVRVNTGDVPIPESLVSRHHTPFLPFLLLSRSCCNFCILFRFYTNYSRKCG